MSADQTARIQWRTAVADPHGGDDVLVRGYSLLELIDRVDFVAAMYLVFTGELPTPPRRRMLDALLVSVIDHGISPSSAVTRLISASGVPIQACVAGGLLTLGDVHGGAGEQFARFVGDTVREHGADAAWDEVAAGVVAGHRAARRRVPGYGHPQHPDGDPRAPRLVATARELGVAGPHVALAVALEQAVENASGRPIPMNIDGAIGSVALDIGLSWQHVRPLCLISRACGLSAHAVEETTRERAWRGIPFDTVAYDGPAARAVPADYPQATA